MNKRLGTLVSVLVLVASAQIASAAQPPRQPGPCRITDSACAPKPCLNSAGSRCRIFRVPPQR